MAEIKDVRLEENLRIKIGEAKNLCPASSGSGRTTCCGVKIDSEEIFRTGAVEKSLAPFFAAEFQAEIPRKFRYLSFYLYDVGSKSHKVLGKVSLRKEELYKYHQKEHWFPLASQGVDTEVQGKVHIEVRLHECLTQPATTDTSFNSHRMDVRVVECSDLTITNGSCNPYAVVSVVYGKLKTKESKRSTVKKKTICPHFDETFSFSVDGKGHNQERSLYAFDHPLAGELSVSLYHDDSKMSREVLGNIFKGTFLGEVKIPLSDIDFSKPHKAWYCLEAKEQKSSEQSLGSIRLKISYTTDYVFPSSYYNALRNLILDSANSESVTSSAAFLLGEVVENKQSAAQPLVKLFLHHGKLVPLIHALAEWEMSTTSDPNTLFRGNSLLTKVVDELMKLVGLPYLQDTLKVIIDQICSESKPCEIDPSRLKEGEDLAANLTNLRVYMELVLSAVVGSGLVCPGVMRDVFSTLKSRAMVNYPDNVSVRYHAVTSFIFLRFFSASILGPSLFDLSTDIPDSQVQRTLTLISKGISGLVNLISSKTNSVMMKEEYMMPLFETFPKSTQMEIRQFLDIISSSSGLHFKTIEAPIVLKEGFMIKRAQGRKKFGLKNFKKRHFRLTNQSLSYSKIKGDKPLFEMPITNILAVERLEEDSFRMKYMFQVVQSQRTLYIQASNCVEEKEWMDLLTKICKSNRNRLKFYHPAAFVSNHWLCCKATDHSLEGCTPVTGGLPLTDIRAGVDSDREVEKIHSLFLQEIDKLDALQGLVEEEMELQEVCGTRAVYSGELNDKPQGLGSNIEEPRSCFATIAEIQKCIITLEQEHLQYLRSVQQSTIIGSIDTPIGDESNADLVRNMNRSSERLSRRGSKSSNASNLSRRSYRGCRSRGGSFRERERTASGETEGVRKSVSGDVSSSGRNLAVDFKSQVKKAASYDAMAIVTGEKDEVHNGTSACLDSEKPGKDGRGCDQLENTSAATCDTRVSSGFETSHFNGVDEGLPNCAHDSFLVTRQEQTGRQLNGMVEIEPQDRSPLGVLETSFDCHNFITSAVGDPPDNSGTESITVSLYKVAGEVCSDTGMSSGQCDHGKSVGKDGIKHNGYQERNAHDFNSQFNSSEEKRLEISENSGSAFEKISAIVPKSENMTLGHENLDNKFQTCDTVVSSETQLIGVYPVRSTSGSSRDLSNYQLSKDQNFPTSSSEAMLNNDNISSSDSNLLAEECMELLPVQTMPCHMQSLTSAHVTSHHHQSKDSNPPPSVLVDSCEQQAITKGLVPCEVISSITTTESG